MDFLGFPSGCLVARLRFGRSHHESRYLGRAPGGLVLVQVSCHGTLYIQISGSGQQSEAWVKIVLVVLDSSDSRSCSLMQITAHIKKKLLLTVI